MLGCRTNCSSPACGVIAGRPVECFFFYTPPFLASCRSWVTEKQKQVEIRISGSFLSFFSFSSFFFFIMYDSHLPNLLDNTPAFIFTSRLHMHGGLDGREYSKVLEYLHDKSLEITRTSYTRKKLCICTHPQSLKDT